MEQRFSRLLKQVPGAHVEETPTTKRREYDEETGASMDVLVTPAPGSRWRVVVNAGIDQKVLATGATPGHALDRAIFLWCR